MNDFITRPLEYPCPCFVFVKYYLHKMFIHYGWITEGAEKLHRESLLKNGMLQMAIMTPILNSAATIATTTATTTTTANAATAVTTITFTTVYNYYALA